MKKFLLLLWVIALAFGVLGTQSALAFPVSGTFGEHEYAVVGFPSAENTFWTAAKDRIAAEGSGWYFADIKSQEEQDYIASLLSTYDTGSNADFVWVGGWQDPIAVPQLTIGYDTRQGNLLPMRTGQKIIIWNRTII